MKFGVRLISELKTAEELKIARQAERADLMLRLTRMKFFDEAGHDALSSNAMIAALQHLLADQMAIHVVVGTVTGSEKAGDDDRMFEVVTAALYSNFTRVAAAKRDAVGYSPESAPGEAKPATCQ